jgi:hypothetical protein
MGFLRRLLGGETGSSASDGGAGTSPGATWTDDDERAHELELARFEQDRTTDLIRRQQRYSDRAWTPPAQGGSRRAGDDESAGERG